ncbi:HAD family hydrolase [Crenobacter cavernae]|uniref:HAD family phosphatase n=1 Tax=Crenobacter cavernae TaxID=2290923 RepID=A0A345Y7U6_9NEIS|nr:HAD family phosphatase [Crenobacter cavernae]AXK39998.1 HAD family phosphatase [Crenobacter cavernae]
MSSPRFDALLFDLDGLMIDSERVGADSWRLAGADLGHEVDEALLAALAGLSVTRSEAVVAQFLGDETLARALHMQSRAHYQRLVHEGEIPLKPGIEALLSWARDADVPRAVATSTMREMADVKLARSGLIRFFEATVAGDEVSETKPAPDVYLAAAARLNVEPARCLVLEDSYYGVLAARAAGMQVILVPDGTPPDEETVAKALAVCSDLNEALSLLRPWFAKR